MEASNDSLSGKLRKTVKKQLCKVGVSNRVFWCNSVLSPPLTGSPAVLLTPGRTRNIAQDMEALRLSRQDNPYLQVRLLTL